MIDPYAKVNERIRARRRAQGRRDDEYDALIRAASQELGAATEAALGLFPIEQRDALLLRDVQGFSYEEIASITVAEIGTVKSRIHRARVTVRNALVEKGWKGSAG